MIALFIGRFQPFHKGHLDAFAQIEADKIIIGIGSAQYSGTENNPYSFTERRKMITKKLDKSNLNYEIIAIPDIHNPPKWVEHVKNIVGKFDVVYTGNELVKNLFLEKGYTVKIIKKNINISGTAIRQKYDQKTKNK